ncbi:MAG: bacteriohopanetetrol glucosamine biosynthesis glycosyltransferase HpnI [Rhizomicrobium sp.]
MIQIDNSIGWTLCLLSVVAVGFTLAAAAAMAPAPRRAPPRRSGRTAVTLLKPLHLAEPGLEENLRSFFRQDHDGPMQIVFGAKSWDDPALRVVERLRRAYPEADIAVVADPGFGGSNPKVVNLINMIAHAKHEVLVMSDSDIRVRPDYLRHILAALDGPDVGAVSCLYSGIPVGNMWARLAAMGIDYHFLPNARLGIALHLAEPCFGSTIALRRKTLEEIGGFESVSNVLADDYELGRAIREKGYRLSIPDSLTVQHVCSQKSALALLRQELRWARTNLLLAKSGYAGTLLTYPVPLALLAVLFQDFSELSLAAVAVALLSRFYLVFRIGRSLGLRADHMWLLPLRDILSFGVFMASFFGKTVVWRGTRYIAEADGALAQL